jgi:hypothetical protein
MGALWEVVKQAYGYLSVLPFIPFAAVYIGTYLYSRDRKQSIQLAIDVTMVFLIGSVSGLFNQLFGGSFGFYGILLVMLIGAGLLGNLQHRTKGRFDPVRIVRIVWRVGFFVLAVLYIIFLIVGLIRSIVQV